MKKRILILLIGAVVSGCGGGSSSGGGSTTFAVPVDFTLDPVAGPTCRNTDDISTYKGSFITSKTCIWQCAIYKGKTNIYVSLDFQRDNKTGAKWHLDHEFTSSGICY